jgi:hypothetical protein
MHDEQNYQTNDGQSKKSSLVQEIDGNKYSTYTSAHIQSNNEESSDIIQKDKNLIPEDNIKNLVNMFTNKLSSLVKVNDSHNLEFYSLDNIMYYLIKECNKRTTGGLKFIILIIITGLLRGFMTPTVTFSK